MLTALFIVAAIVLATSAVRRPRKTWERAITALAGVLMLAVIVAWGIDYVVSSAKAAPAPAAPSREGEVVPLDPVLIDTTDFEIAGLTWTHHFKGVTVFNVQGVITNKTSTARDVPDLRIILRDGAGAEIMHWTVAPAAQHLAANARTSFDAHLDNPPPHKTFDLRFEPVR